MEAGSWKRYNSEARKRECKVTFHKTARQLKERNFNPYSFSPNANFYLREKKSFYLFLSSSAGGIQQILESDCFLEQAEFLIRTAAAGGIRRCVMSSRDIVATLYVLCNLFIFLCQVQIWTWPPTKTITAKARKLWWERKHQLATWWRKPSKC